MSSAEAKRLKRAEAKERQAPVTVAGVNIPPNSAQGKAGPAAVAGVRAATGPPPEETDGIAAAVATAEAEVHARSAAVYRALLTDRPRGRPTTEETARLLEAMQVLNKTAGDLAVDTAAIRAAAALAETASTIDADKQLLAEASAAFIEFGQREQAAALAASRERTRLSLTVGCARNRVRTSVTAASDLAAFKRKHADIFSES